MSKLYCSVTNTSDIFSVTVNLSHGSSSCVATVECKTTSLNLGDSVEIDIGYTTNHAKVFTGYVKSIEYNVPSNVYTLTINDAMVRALDYYIVSTNPETPLSYRNISAESLVETLFTLCGLTDFEHDDTSFVFGVNNAFEINQVSVYDYCRTICDLLTWHIWCDENGTAHFENRKPFLMTGSEPQVGWEDDGAGKGNLLAYTWSDSKTIEIQNHSDERNLRNRVVVYGAGSIYAEAVNSSSPYFHYKTAVLGAGELIDTQEYAQQTADYNLYLFDRITESLRATVVGDPSLLARYVVTVNSTKLGIAEDYYIYSAEHNWSSGGYTVSLELRK